MKLSILKTGLSLALVISANCISMPSAYADAFLRTNLGERTYTPNDQNTLLQSKLNSDYFNNALFINYTFPIPTRGWLGLPGIEKRPGVFKLQKSSNGKPNGPREELVLPSKGDAKKLCDLLAETARADIGSPSGIGTIFVSSWMGYDQQAVAVAYGEPTAAKKYWICPNPLKVELDPKLVDENELSGIKQSDLDHLGNYYDVECFNPQKPIMAFYRNQIKRWSNGTDHYPVSSEKMTLPLLDEEVGAKYCAAR